ncbi:DgyrCDS4722 [Dimorphilus gyrociliatus]|uniref:DgyrCDS4722 n=1 Tax=Dimorphilus gyrociliatus TaxID=2664684 RepID=A0A7I8VJ86_9ANNE|nr:DgyrCDS4722 [Dimorphilus gyrociliatus]
MEIGAKLILTTGYHFKIEMSQNQSLCHDYNCVHYHITDPIPSAILSREELNVFYILFHKIQTALRREKKDTFKQPFPPDFPSLSVGSKRKVKSLQSSKEESVKSIRELPLDSVRSRKRICEEAERDRSSTPITIYNKGMLLDRPKEEKIQNVLKNESENSEEDIDDIIEMNDWSLVEVPEEQSLAICGISRNRKGYEQSRTVIRRRSSRIVQCLGNSSIYLVGRINEEAVSKYDFSQEMIAAFKNGFPPDWKQYVKYHYKQKTIRDRIEQPISYNSFENDSATLGLGCNSKNCFHIHMKDNYLIEVLSTEEIKIFTMLVQKIQTFNETRFIKFGICKDEVRSVLSRDSFDRQSSRQNMNCARTVKIEDSKSETDFSDSEGIDGRRKPEKFAVNNQRRNPSKFVGNNPLLEDLESKELNESIEYEMDEICEPKLGDFKQLFNWSLVENKTETGIFYIGIEGFINDSKNDIYKSDEVVERCKSNLVECRDGLLFYLVGQLNITVTLQNGNFLTSVLT